MRYQLILLRIIGEITFKNTMKDTANYFNQFQKVYPSPWVDIYSSMSPNIDKNLRNERFRKYRVGLKKSGEKIPTKSRQFFIPNNGEPEESIFKNDRNVRWFFAKIIL